MAEESKQEESFDDLAQKAKQDNGSGEKKETPKDMRGMIDQLEATLDDYMVKRAPFHIPAGGKEFLATISPYVILVFAVLTIPVILAGLGLTAFFSPFAAMGGYYSFGVLGLISGAFALASMIVELMAVKGLFARTHAAWRLMYYASLISFVGNIVSFNIVGGIIGAIIGWYILFQIKSLYTK